MFRSFIVADDLTGANATGSLLKKVGLNVASLFHLSGRLPRETDAIAYSTDSRGVSREEAYRRVKEAVAQLSGSGDGEFCCNKRIDSTLRGNVGAEIDGALDALGDGYVAVVVPAYPNSGRIVLNRTMLVNGVLLTASDAGRDPKMPITTNNVEEIVGGQTRYPYSYFTLDEITKGVDALAEAMKESARRSRVLIMDAVRNEDIITIAQATIKAGLKVVTVDPGPFTMYYLKEQQVKENTEQKVLMVIGSVTGTTRQQMAYILQERRIFFCQMDVEKFFADDTREAEIERAAALITGALDDEDVLLLTTTPLNEQEMLDLPQVAKRLGTDVEAVSKIISGTLTETAARILEKTKKIDGIYSSGGDITVSLLDRLGADGVNIRDEVIPLAVYGRVIGGTIDNMKLVTKGGMIGGRDAIKLCLNKIANDI